MNNDVLQAIEDSTVAVLAAEVSTGKTTTGEAWSKDYDKIPNEHAQLIRLTAKLERQILAYFKEMSGRIDSFVRWDNYGHMVQAYGIEVFVDETQLDKSDTQFIKIIFDTIATVTALGAVSGHTMTGVAMPIGLEARDEIIQKLTTDQIGALIGKKIDPNTGLLVDNPNAAMNIDETTRTRIANSIKTSINLGESQQEATDRLRSTIADGKRASLIARTETIRAFAAGRMQFGRMSGATGHQWSDSNATDDCADNTAQGIIPIDQDFISGDPYEPAHPNCKCLTRLVYADEYSPADAADDSFSTADEEDTAAE